MEELKQQIYNDENLARIYFETLRWGYDLDNIFCAYCGETKKISPAKMMSKPTKTTTSKPLKGYYHCRTCKKRFTVRTGTIFERSHIPLNKWVAISHLLTGSDEKISAQILHKKTAVTYKTAWLVLKKIGEAIGIRQDELKNINSNNQDELKNLLMLKIEFDNLGRFATPRISINKNTKDYENKLRRFVIGSKRDDKSIIYRDLRTLISRDH